MNTYDSAAAGSHSLFHFAARECGPAQRCAVCRRTGKKTPAGFFQPGSGGAGRETNGGQLTTPSLNRLGPGARHV